MGGHYYDTDGDDPWLSTQYVTNSKGCATVNITVANFSLDQSWPVAYRAVVAHLSSASSAERVACGLIGVPKASVATMAPYPGYTPGYTVEGTVAVTDMANGITVMGTLGGLETSATGGIHVHSGVTCDDSSLVGGHYWPDMASDPWTTTYTSDDTGSASVSFFMPSFSLSGDNPVAGRAVVVHASNGDRIACGLLMSTVGEVVTLVAYPGNAANNDTIGTLVVTQNSTGVSIMGTVANVETNCTDCGLHIHTGRLHSLSQYHMFELTQYSPQVTPALIQVLLGVITTTPLVQTHGRRLRTPPMPPG